MKLIIQKVSRASVRAEGRVVGEIAKGFAILVGLERGDSVEQIDRAAAKVAVLRAFEDDNGKLNRDLRAVDGAVLAVSQFTLAGSIRKGRRPSFDRAMPGKTAEPLFRLFCDRLRSAGIEVQTGVFGAYMEVEIVNAGPVTLIWDDPPES